jgi:1-acyl-sn-glycerol-3-phosphate acyltransferase
VTFYQFARGIVLSLFKVLFRVRVVGKERVPKHGAYIVAPSHRSILDIPFAAFITTRTVRFLAKDDLFSTPLGRRLFDALGAVEVERGTADRGALRVLEQVLAEGSPVAVFPEGTRRSGPQITDLYAGAAFLAVKLGVPIVPVGIGGSEHILPKGKRFPRIHRVAVSVGRPIPPPPLDGRSRRAAATKLTEELRAELQRCFDDAERLAR